jgi:hypothetical protein
MVCVVRNMAVVNGSHGMSLRFAFVHGTSPLDLG